MNGFFYEMNREYLDGLKALNRMKAKYMEQLRRAARDRDIQRQDNIERVLGILKAEISETMECLTAIKDFEERSEETV